MHKNLITQIEEKVRAAGILPLKNQAELSTKILQERLEIVLPWAMETSGLDFWIIVARENCMDPILKTLYPWDMIDVRRLGIIAFHRDHATGHIRKMVIGPTSPAMDKLYEKVQKPDESVWDAIARVVKECNPAKIAVNRSRVDGFSDGLSSTLYEELKEALNDDAAKLSDGESLTVRWLQRFTPLEKETMRVLVQVTQEIIAYSFSQEFIKVGETTTTDVEWFMRNVINRLGFLYWFGPDVNLQRQGINNPMMADEVILPGDLIHCDIGLKATYVQLHTDMQWMAYIRREGESKAPQEFVELLAKGNRLQDIVMEKMGVCDTGNDAFLAALETARSEGLRPMVYTHPLGTFGHGAGPLIGKYTQQEFIPIAGERPLEEQTFYALELNVANEIKAWNDQLVYMFLEEDICKDGLVHFICGRQEELILV